MLTTTRKQQIDFPTVAIIRKGAKKQPDRPGKDLESVFRVVFEPGMEAYAKKFKEIYGDFQPEVINAMLPFAEIGDCYEVSNEAYQAGMLVFKAVNGRVIVHRDPETSEYLVRNGEAQKTGVNLEFDPFEQTAITYKGHDGTQKRLPIKTQTRLKLFIPEMEDLVWFLLKTTSYYDSLNISGNMAAVQAVAESATGGSVAGVRINVFRAQQDILWNSKDGPRRIKKWLVHVKVDPDWVKKMIVRMSANTLNAGTQVQGQLQAPDSGPDPELDADTSEDQQDGDQNVIEGVIVESNKQAHVSTEEAVQAIEEVAVTGSRPYSPVILKLRLQERTKAHEGEEATDHDRKVIVMLLAERFGGNDDKRHTVQEYLFGSKSLTDATDAQILAAQDWMHPQQNPDTNEYFMTDDASVECGKVLDQALIEQGQKALF